MREDGIAAIPADSIGQEVVAAGFTVLEALQARDGDFPIVVERFPWGSDYYRRHGRMMAEDGRETLRRFDAIFFGAGGDPGIPDHVTPWGLRLPICQGFDQYANARPARVLTGITPPLRNCAPGDLDRVILRENRVGGYAGHGGRVHRGLPEKVTTETPVFTRAGVTRIMRFGFRLARKRPRRPLTVVTRSNAQCDAMVMWGEIAAEVAKEYPDATCGKELVDAMTKRMVLKARTMDVIVASNLRADLLSDLAAAPAGSLGRALTANLNPERRFPSMFEPIHGSAFDIAGKGIATPIATFRTAVMTLEYLRKGDAAARLMATVERVTASPAFHTPDLGGKATMARVTEAAGDALRSAKYSR